MNRDRTRPKQMDPNTKATLLSEAAIVCFLLALWLISRV